MRGCGGFGGGIQTVLRRFLTNLGGLWCWFPCYSSSHGPASLCFHPCDFQSGYGLRVFEAQPVAGPFWACGAWGVVGTPPRDFPTHPSVLEPVYAF